MQIKKSLRFLLISLCIMSVHNVVFAGYKETAEACQNYYTKPYRKYIDLTSNKCKDCLGNGSNLVLVKLESDVLKYCLNSEISSDFLILGNETACKGAGQGVSFEAPDNSVLLNAGVAKCKTCPENTYALAYNDVKHQNDYLTQVYDVYELNECVTCAGTDYQRYYAKDGECKPCPDGYRCDINFACDSLKYGATGGLIKCGLCVEDDYGKDGNNDCKKCSTSGKVSIARFSTNGAGLNRVHNECIEKSECNTEGYGVNEEKNTCEKCGNGKVSQADANGIYRCVENDPCASDASCTTAGCGKVGDSCQQCSRYSIFVPDGEYNVCISAPTNTMNCSSENKSCVCKDGYEVIEGFDGEETNCEQCMSGWYSNSSTNRVCTQCNGKLTTQNGLNVGCTACGDNEQPNSNHTACVCKKGYGRNAQNSNCRKCGGAEHPGETSIPEGSGYKCENVGFGKVPTQYDNDSGLYFGGTNCKSFEKIAEYDNSICVDYCANTGFNSETGYGKYTDTENGLSQCVKCANYGRVSKPDNDNSGAYICVAECGAYQIVQNGSCGYCSTIQFYNFDTKKCVNTCNNSYPVSAGDTNVNVCCGEYQYFDKVEGKCKSCDTNQWFNSASQSCQNCPTNFACNGNTKIKCPFGTVAEAGTGACISKDFQSGGFLYNLDGVYTNVSENDYYKADDEGYYERFGYYSCGEVNGYREPEPYEIDLGEQYEGYTIDTTNIYVCHQCENTERPKISGGCLCGQQTRNPTAGLIKDIVPGGHGEICQVCPLNDVKIGQQDESYTCNPCPEGEGFYWNNGEYVCAKCGTDEYSGLEDTGLYTYTDAGKNKYTWCLTHTELVAVMGQDAESYYIGDENVWDYCPAGSCCLLGKKYSCKKGTVSLANMMCEKGTPGQCADCGGKTTKSEETSCNGFLSIDTCKSNMCTESIIPTTFCFDGKDKEEMEEKFGDKVANMCFEIEKIKMSLKESVGVYNTIDITKTDSGQ